MATADVCASLPLIGRHLEPLGTIAAAGAWMSRVSSATQEAQADPSVPDVAEPEADGRLRDRIKAAVTTGLRGVVTPGDLDRTWPAADPLPPVLHAVGQRRRHLHRSSVQYGPSSRQVLDVWRRKDLTGPAPVLVFAPGGGWIHGGRVLQGHALMSHLAELGWVCLSVEYRVAPRHRWPRHVQDVKAAIAWARANADQFGGDRDFVAVAGASAGGHLAALAGLTPGDAEFDGELDATADSSVDAVVGLYGRYDWADRSTRERDQFVSFLERIVVRKSFESDPDAFRAASPIARVRPDAPPFLVVHGTADGVIPVAQARAFVTALRETSQSPVSYVELPGAGHAFDLVDRWYTRAMNHSVGLFLDEAHRTHRLRVGQKAI